MEDTELERLVVRLTGDGSQYQQMLQQAQASTVQASQTIQTASLRIEDFSNSIKSFAGAAMTALGALGAIAFFEGAREGYQELQVSQIRLNNAIEANHGNLATAVADYAKLAQEISDTTSTSKGEVRAMVTTAQQRGLDTEQTKNAIHTAVAMSGALGGNAEGYMRAAAMAEKGAKTQLYMMLGLRGVKGEAEKAAEAEKILASGYKDATEIGQTAGEQLKRMIRDMGALRMVIGQALTEALLPLIQVGKQIIKVSMDWVKTHKELIGTVVKTIAALGTSWAIYKGIGLAIMVVNASLATLHIQQLISTGAWLIWKGVVFAAQAIMALYTFQVALWNGAITAAIALMGGWSIASGIATAATWLWNAALTVMDVLLAPELLIGAAIALVAIAGTIGIVAVAVGTVAAAGIAAWKAGTALFDVLKDIPTTEGPLYAVGSLFYEWFGIIKDIVRAVQVDLPLAWDIAKAGFQVAVLEVKSLWPPLWEFVKSGFKAVWEFVTAEFTIRFYQAISHIGFKMVALFQNVPGMHDFVEGLRNELVNLDNDIVTVHHQAARKAKADLEAALASFKAPAETPELRQARQWLDILRDDLADVEKEQKKIGSTAIDDPLKKATAEATKFDAALFGSNEALQRIDEYHEKIGFNQKQMSGNIPVTPAEVGAVGDAVNKATGVVVGMVGAVDLFGKKLEAVLGSVHGPGETPEASAAAREARLAEATRAGDVARQAEAATREARLAESAQAEEESRKARESRITDANRRAEDERRARGAAGDNKPSTDRMEILLAQIRDLMKDKKPAIEVQPAGI